MLTVSFPSSKNESGVNDVITLEHPESAVPALGVVPLAVIFVLLPVERAFDENLIGGGIDKRLQGEVFAALELAQCGFVHGLDRHLGVLLFWSVNQVSFNTVIIQKNY